MSYRIYNSKGLFVVVDTVTWEVYKKETTSLWYNYNSIKAPIVYSIYQRDPERPLVLDQSYTEFTTEDGTTFADDAALQNYLDFTLGASRPSSGDISNKPLNFDAWGRPKVVNDVSLFHGMFTYNVPITQWYERLNDVEQAFSNATSADGALELLAGATLNDKTNLRTFRNLRYEPNRGHLYSTSVLLPNVSALQNRRFGIGTDENAVFFSLESGTLYGVVRTTTSVGGTVEDKVELDTEGIDLTKGNIFDIQFQWRGVGDYKFFINLSEVGSFDYLGTLDSLSMANPSLPVFYENENLGANEKIIGGCVDVSTEGGINNGKSYGSVNISNESGQVAVSGFNTPIIAIRSKLTVSSLINTRDTLALLASAYADQRAFIRVWATRDFTAIAENQQAWTDFGDGHLEYIEYDNPNVGTPMTFDTAKAELIFGSRIDMDQTYSTSALFEGRTSIYLTPGEMFVFTIHRETGQATNVGVTFEFAEEI
jgi:hypothetical protein